MMLYSPERVILYGQNTSSELRLPELTSTASLQKAFTARNCVMNMADRQMLSFLYLTGLTERK